MLYADPEVAKHVLARWEIVGDALARGVESKRSCSSTRCSGSECCHTGGGMAWDANGQPVPDGREQHRQRAGAQTDERPGRAPGTTSAARRTPTICAARSSAFIPSRTAPTRFRRATCFRPARRGTRPEIYAMGIAMPGASRSTAGPGYIYWGEVGPDANEDTEVGRSGYDELNQARGPGFFGWPYFIGENDAYPVPRLLQGSAARRRRIRRQPTNTSVNNTGLRELPPAQPAFIAYPVRRIREVPGARERRAGARPAGRSTTARTSAATRRGHFPTTTRASGSRPTCRADGSCAIAMDDERRLSCRWSGSCRRTGRRKPSTSSSVRRATSTSSTTAASGSRRARRSARPDRIQRRQPSAGGARSRRTRPAGSSRSRSRSRQRKPGTSTATN